MIHQIWSEGYQCTGQSGKAEFMGFSIGETFESACLRKFKKNPYYNKLNNTYWGCRLFNNERDARRNFG